MADVLPSSFSHPFSYRGITTLITGASMGIGKCFAEELAARGSNLILTARSKEKLETLAAQLHEKFGVRVQVFSFDLSRPEAPLALYNAVRESNTDVDLLINNAGFGDLGYFEQSDYNTVSRMVELNIHALTTLTHLFLKPMLIRKKGGIMNIASTAAFQPIPKLALYSATKAFVLSFTEALWAEVKSQGIRVLCLCPGNTESEFHATAKMPGKYVFLRAKTADLVRHGLHVFEKSDRPTTIHGWFNRMLAWSERLLPRRGVLWVTSQLYR